MVPDLPELHDAKRTPSLKGKQNSGLALRDRRPLWHPASAGRAHFDTRGQLAVPRRRLRAGAVTRSLGPSLRSEEHTSELQSQSNLVCRLLLEKKKQKKLTTSAVIWQDTHRGDL